MLVEREAQVDVVGRLGEGTFSVVEKAKVKEVDATFVALKRIHPNSSPRRILGELQCLRLLSGKPNLARLCGAYRESQRFTIVLEYFVHDKLKSYLNTIGASGLRAYMRGLFTALAHAHECGEFRLRMPGRPEIDPWWRRQKPGEVKWPEQCVRAPCLRSMRSLTFTRQRPNPGRNRSP